MLCRSEDVRIYRSFASQDLISQWNETFQIDITNELSDNHQIDLIHCSDCDLQYFNPIRPGSSLFYEQLQKFDWYYLPEKWEYKVASRDLRDANSILEIGCGPGFFKAHLNVNQNRKIYGLETNQVAAKMAVSKGYEVVSDSLDELLCNCQFRFDSIVLFQVLEHLENPRELLFQLKSLLKPNGRLIITVPNLDGYLRLVDPLLNLPPHHLTRWSQRTLEKVGLQLGFKVIRFECEPLAKYHITSFVEAYMTLFRRPRLGLLLNRNILPRFLISLLYRTGLYKFCRGEGLYVCYQNS
jgi:SAM-dependent methyltransferase